MSDVAQETKVGGAIWENFGGPVMRITRMKEDGPEYEYWERVSIQEQADGKGNTVRYKRSLR